MGTVLERLPENYPLTEKLPWFGKSFEGLGREQMGAKWPGSEAILSELYKAMASTNLPGFGDATPLRLEVLDGTMTSVLLRQEHLKMFNAIPRVPSPQQIFQWNRRLDRGSHRGNLGFTEGGAPKGGVARWQRNQAQVMFMGTKRGYTHQLLTMGQMGGTQVDPVTEENQNGTLALLESLERHFFFGNSDILDDDNNVVNYDGLKIQMELAGPSHVIDMQGEPLDFPELDDVAERFVTEAYLLNSSLLKNWTTPFVLSDLNRRMRESQRIQRGVGDPTPAVYGTPIKGYSTQFFDLGFEPSILLEEVRANKPLAATEAGVGILKPATVTLTVTADATSKMPAGTYYYSASAGRDAGDTDNRASIAQAVAAGERVNVTIAEVATTTRYRLYRGISSDVTTHRLVATLPALVGGGNPTYQDKNQTIPDTGIMIFANMTVEALVMAQLAPLIKFPQPVSGTTFPFLLLLYHVLALKAWEHVQIIKNIGRLPR